MKLTPVPAMDLRRRAGELLSRIRYAGERFIIEKNGEPVAALIGIEDLRRLETLEKQNQEGRVERQQALAMAQAIREAVLARRGGVPLPDTTDDLRRMREERSSDLSNLR